MVTQKTISQLKHSNISADAEKTMRRVREIWKPLSKQEREEILSTAGITKVSVERSYKNGNISAKLAAAIAYTQKIDPGYLTGEADEPQEYSDSLLEQFLARLGYTDIIMPDKPKRKYVRKDKADIQESEKLTEQEAVLPAKTPSAEPLRELDAFAENLLRALPAKDIEAIDNIPNGDLAQLISGLAIRARFSEANKNAYMLLKYVLANK